MLNKPKKMDNDITVYFIWGILFGLSMGLNFGLIWGILGHFSSPLLVGLTFMFVGMGFGMVSGVIVGEFKLKKKKRDSRGDV